MDLPLILIGALLIFDTIFILSRSNVNMGVLAPALLGLPLLIYGLFYTELHLWFSLGWGVVMKWCIIGCYAAFLLMLTVTTLLIVGHSRAPVSADADAVIVLGAGVHGTRVSRALQNRLELALEYLETNDKAVVVLSGGQGKQEDVTEASAMKEYMTGRGFPADRLICEDRSTSTFENFKYSRELLEARFGGEYTAVFVTNDFHVYRAGLAAKEAGLDIEGVGCGSPFYIIPNYYLRECMAIMRCLVFGFR